MIVTLHRHAQGFRPPPGFTRPVLDIRYLTWAGTWHAGQLARRPIDPAVRRVLAETAGRVEAVLARLGQDRAGNGLIHADLDLDNVLDHHGQARPIDFDDASWGHYALDLAIAADSIPETLRPVLTGGLPAWPGRAAPSSRTYSLSSSPLLKVVSALGQALTMQARCAPYGTRMEPPVRVGRPGWLGRALAARSRVDSTASTAVMKAGDTQTGFSYRSVSSSLAATAARMTASPGRRWRNLAVAPASRKYSLGGAAALP